MNRLQLTTAIGQRTGLIAPNDIIASNNFLTMRHDQLWRSFLWKDSLCQFVITIDTSAADYVPASNYMPTKGNLILPPAIGQVIACRTNLNKMNVERPMIYYRVNQDQFARSGLPLDFMLLPAAVWEFDTVQSLLLGVGSVTDIGQVETLDLLQADGVTSQRTLVPLSAVPATLKTDRVDNWFNPSAVIAPVVLGYANGTTLSILNIIPAGTTYPYQFQSQMTPGEQYTITWGANETQLQYGIYNINVVTVNNPGAGQTTVINYPAGANLFALLTAVGANGINLPITAQVNQVVPFVSPVVTLQAGTIAAPKCQRIRFVGIPNTGATVRVLGKLVTPPFSADTDTPGVSGMEGILFALAYYDMCYRDERQGEEIQSALNEAVGPQYLATGKPGGFLAQLIREETEQAAWNSRIMPEEGFGGDEYFQGTWGTKSNPY